MEKRLEQITANTKFVMDAVRVDWQKAVEKMNEAKSKEAKAKAKIKADTLLKVYQRLSVALAGPLGIDHDILE